MTNPARADEHFSLPTPQQHLGNDYDTTWDYNWVLPTSVLKLNRLGFTLVGKPLDFIFGSQMVLVGRPHKETSANG